jgi:hypothetical protein
VYLIGQMKTGMMETASFSKQGYGKDVAILREWAGLLVPAMGQPSAA